MVKLNKISVKGFKSISRLENFEPGQLNVLIGPNGAGKSNFIGFFDFLRAVFTYRQMQDNVAYHGGAGAMLHDGLDTTNIIEAQFELETEDEIIEYAFVLMYAKPDRLVFREEKYRTKKDKETDWHYMHGYLEESGLVFEDNKTAKAINSFWQGIAIYQFHNTSEIARIRNRWSVQDGMKLMHSGENLGSFLYNLKQNQYPYYNRIKLVLRMVLPFFDDFELENQYGYVYLKWREKGSAVVFNSTQASDGMLRIFCLFSLLGQDPDHISDVVFLDEPELGLHPSAIETLAGLIKKVSLKRQLFVCTQSVSILNYFNPEDIVVVDRKQRSSVYSKLDVDNLQSWLETYSLGVLWDKNVLGGRP
ncbi:MAG: AAA family ATPase [Bacteroidota bacterium]